MPPNPPFILRTLKIADNTSASRKALPNVYFCTVSLLSRSQQIFKATAAYYSVSYLPHRLCTLIVQSLITTDPVGPDWTIGFWGMLLRPANQRRPPAIMLDAIY